MIARLQKKVNRTYRDVATVVYTWGLAYLALLWVAAALDFQAVAVGAMWVVGIFLLPVAWFQPTNLGLLSIVEWLNKRDDAKKWDVARVGMLLFICVMSLGGLSVLMSIMGVGVAFPVVIPFIALIVACMVYAGEINSAKWMKILAWIAVVIMTLCTIKVVPFGEWSRGFYDKTGYTVDVGPSKREVAARKAMAENERLADIAISECIDSWKKENMGRRKVVREDQIVAAVAACNAKYQPTASPPSHKEGAGGYRHGGNPHAGKTPEWFPSWARDWGPLQWMLGTIGGGVLLHVLLWGPFVVLLGWLGFKIGKKNNEGTVATTTKVVEKTKVAGTIFGLTFFEWAVGVAVIWLGLSIYVGTAISSVEDFRKTPKHMAAEKVAGYPGQFFTMDELPQWVAVVEGPQVHHFFGDMSGRLNLVKLASSGKRADIVSQFESGSGLIVVVDELDPRKDIVFNNARCPQAKIPLGGNRHQTICTSTGRSGDGSLRFSIEMSWSITERYAVVTQVDTQQAIRLTFLPRFP